MEGLCKQSVPDLQLILMKEVLVELEKDMTTIGFPKSTIESRKLNIVKCFKKDISLSTYIDNVLHKRNLK